MDNLQPKYPIGARVRIANEMHRNNEIGHVEKAKAIVTLNKIQGYKYYIRFKDGAVSSFFEKNINEIPHITRPKKDDSQLHIESTVRNICSVSPVFSKSGYIASEFFNESPEPSVIRTVTEKDVAGRHFIDWFFSLDKWVGNDPEQFPFDMIIHNDEFSVYGYFNKDKLNGLIRIDEDDNLYELSFFCVNEAVQRHGIGQRLLRHVLLEFNDKKLLLNVYTRNHSAIHIYKKHGFKITGSGYGKGYSPKLKHYVMQRNIPKKLYI